MKLRLLIILAIVSALAMITTATALADEETPGRGGGPGDRLPALADGACDRMIMIFDRDGNYLVGFHAPGWGTLMALCPVNEQQDSS